MFFDNRKMLYAHYATSFFWVGAWEFNSRRVTEFKKLFIESQQWRIYVWTCAKILLS
jgi:hypothetical protein